MTASEEKCEQCERPLSEHKVLTKTIEGKTFRFCSGACAAAFKEVRKKREEVTGPKYRYTLFDLSHTDKTKD